MFAGSNAVLDFVNVATDIKKSVIKTKNLLVDGIVVAFSMNDVYYLPLGTSIVYDKSFPCKT